MHKSLCFLLIFLSLFGAVSAQTGKTYLDKDRKKTSKKEAVYYRIVKSKAGLFKVTDYFINGNPQFTGTSKTKTDPLVLEGKCTWYGENGKVTQEGFFTDGKPDGASVSYYSDGAKKNEGTYQNGLLNGIYRDFFPSGAIQAEATFKNGKIDGRLVKYFNETQKKEEVYFSNGKEDGPYEFYNVNGKLFNKGTARDGAQEGTCYDYYYEGPLRKIYTVHDRLLDGDFYEFTSNGDTAAVGFFEMGKPVRYKATSLRKVNGSVFSGEMELRNGIEYWKTYRDGKLVLEHRYHYGIKDGIWTLYTYDGSAVYQTIDYTGTDCADIYLQYCKEKFDPFFFLSSRFRLPGLELLKDKPCTPPTTTDVFRSNAALSEDDHPIHHHKPQSPETAPAVKITDAELSRRSDGYEIKTRGLLTRDLDYKEPAKAAAFLEKNACVSEFDKKYPGVTACRRKIGGIDYRVFTSDNPETLLKLKNALTPGTDEIQFFYQTYPERKYLAGEPTPDRYLGFNLPQTIREAIRGKIMSDLSIIQAIENDFFKGFTFSGISAFGALEKAVGK